MRRVKKPEKKKRKKKNNAKTPFIYFKPRKREKKFLLISYP